MGTDAEDQLAPAAQQMVRPTRRQCIQEVDVRDDLTLLAAPGDQGITLNASGRAIWELCDGQHTIIDMFRELSHRYACADVDLLADLTATLLRLQSLNVIELSGEEISNRSPVKFVVGIEDIPLVARPPYRDPSGNGFSIQ